jgi:trans-aconitate 2-methyltransferase
LAAHPIHLPSVLAPEVYARLLYDLGFAEQHVRLQVYGHLLPSTGEVVEWLKGSYLTPFREGLAPAFYEEFLHRYRSRLVAALGDHRPYFYPFKRILGWAHRP